MKRLFFISALFVGMLFSFSSCCSTDEDTPTPTPSPTPTPTPPEAGTYLKQLLADNTAILQQYPNFEGSFREAQYELNGIVAQMSAEDLKAVSVNYVYAYADMVEHSEPLLQVTRNFQNGFGLVYHLSKATSPYEGSAPINPAKAQISLEEALKLVKEANVVPPQTKFVTLRQYVYKDLPSIYYIFGGKQDRTVDIYVDAVTGEVLSFTNDK